MGIFAFAPGSLLNGRRQGPSAQTYLPHLPEVNQLYCTWLFALVWIILSEPRTFQRDGPPQSSHPLLPSSAWLRMPCAHKACGVCLEQTSHSRSSHAVAKVARCPWATRSCQMQLHNLAPHPRHCPPPGLLLATPSRPGPRQSRFRGECVRTSQGLHLSARGQVQRAPGRGRVCWAPLTFGCLLISGGR